MTMLAIFIALQCAWTWVYRGGSAGTAGGTGKTNYPAGASAGGGAGTDGGNRAVVITDEAGTTTYSTPGTFTHTVS
jgi:hypothetical protein